MKPVTRLLSIPARWLAPLLLAAFALATEARMESASFVHWNGFAECRLSSTMNVRPLRPNLSTRENQPSAAA